MEFKDYSKLLEDNQGLLRVVWDTCPPKEEKEALNQLKKISDEQILNYLLKALEGTAETGNKEGLKHFRYYNKEIRAKFKRNKDFISELNSIRRIEIKRNHTLIKEIFTNSFNQELLNNKDYKNISIAALEKVNNYNHAVEKSTYLSKFREGLIKLYKRVNLISRLEGNYYTLKDIFKNSNKNENYDLIIKLLIKHNFITEKSINEELILDPKIKKIDVVRLGIVLYNRGYLQESFSPTHISKALKQTFNRYFEDRSFTKEFKIFKENPNIRNLDKYKFLYFIPISK